MTKLIELEVTVRHLDTITSISTRLVNDSLERKLTFSDRSDKYILIDLGMIFVSDWPAEELEQHINVDDCLSYEAYDTSDGCSYYLGSEYAMAISDALLYLANKR